MSLAAARLPLAHRFFFALKPDEVTARRTHAFAEREFGEKGLLRLERHHITLALTDDLAEPEQGLIERLLCAGDGVAAAPFDLDLDRLSASATSIALRPGHIVPPLRALHQAIAGAMAQQEIGLRSGWRFSPHETLCYRRGTPFSRPVHGFHWQVTHFVLIHSFVGLTHHETIRSWPLSPPAEAQYGLF